MFFFVRMFLVLAALLILPALCLHLAHLRGKRERRSWRVALWSVTAVLLAGVAAYVLYGLRSGSPHWLWHAFYPLLLGVGGVEIFLCLGTLLGWTSRRNPFLRRVLTGLGVTLAALNIIMVTMAYFIGNKRIDVVEYTFSSKDLPKAFDGLKVVLITDLHLGTYGTDTTRVAQLIDKTMEQHGDIILFGGDLVNFESKEAEPFRKQLSRLKAPYGVYSVLGNHDYGVYRNFDTKAEQVTDIQRLIEMQEECGWTVLRNDNVTIEKDGQRIAIVGMENDGPPPFPKLGNTFKALKGLPETIDGAPLFKILMTHDPSHWRRNILHETDAQLTVAGHTHGMQFKLAGWSPASMVYKEWGGQYYRGDRCMVVSVGLGLGAVPFRFGAWSEVCVIRLNSQT